MHKGFPYKGRDSLTPQGNLLQHKGFPYNGRNSLTLQGNPLGHKGLDYLRAIVGLFYTRDLFCWSIGIFPYLLLTIESSRYNQIHHDYIK